MASTEIILSVHVRWPWLVVLLWHLHLRRLAMWLVRVDTAPRQSVL